MQLPPFYKVFKLTLLDYVVDRGKMFVLLGFRKFDSRLTICNVNRKQELVSLKATLTNCVRQYKTDQNENNKQA